MGKVAKVNVHGAGECRRRVVTEQETILPLRAPRHRAVPSIGWGADALVIFSFLSQFLDIVDCRQNEGRR